LLVAGNTLYNSNFKKIAASSIKTRQDVDRMLLIVAENSFTFDSLFDHSPFDQRPPHLNVRLKSRSNGRKVYSILVIPEVPKLAKTETTRVNVEIGLCLIRQAYPESWSHGST
jgi:hypothetical protein